MKWLTLILSVYLLGLSLWPCTDEPLPTPGQAGRAMMLSATAFNPDGSGAAHHHEHDACSPFCTCACCAVTITVVPRFQYTFSPSVDITPVAVASFGYASDRPLDPISAIWQPPQLRV